MIRVENISKTINKQKILDNISLNLEMGKCYGFVGYNGSGKTMLLRAICGFLKVDAGRIIIDESELGKDIDFILDAGIVIGETEFMEHYSGYMNLKLLARINKRIDDLQIIEALRKMNLEEEKDKKVKKYSLGMKQRLRLAQAFMENPEILVLDEPFNALDGQGVKEIQALIQEAKKQNKTILLTSHDERNIELLCDKVYQMDHGRICEQ